ncbi:MAG: hypothetical protein JSU86_02615 [Phycisphaerales bacterium]|nr:MAG: hypothetical protein JSU86_02615 [Phycisphaerales bacterium]
MTSDEKTQLLALFDNEGKWCQGCEALDSSGNAVRYDDETAVAWDIVGGVCHLFGWRRARELFGQLHRHISGRQRTHCDPNEDISAMAALFDFNDAFETTYEKVVATLEGLPVWRGRSSSVEKNPMCET